NAFGTPGQISPVTQTDLTVLQALGFQLTHAAVAGNLTPSPASGPTSAQTTVQNTQATVQNTGGSPRESSPGLDHTIAMFSQFMAAGFPEQHGAQSRRTLSRRSRPMSRRRLYPVVMVRADL